MLASRVFADVGLGFGTGVGVVLFAPPRNHEVADCQVSETLLKMRFTKPATRIAAVRLVN
jgi:hypothetical protein